eukprot:GHVQ01010787.1.p1 GENE.GHVQ01010787.1~~GHVQ01010787.1.p1  ORF type:complete len:109 (-),score=10.31 GHVQ01010787.1:49-339(-)
MSHDRHTYDIHMSHDECKHNVPPYYIQNYTSKTCVQQNTAGTAAHVYVHYAYDSRMTMVGVCTVSHEALTCNYYCSNCYRYSSYTYEHNTHVPTVL